MVFKRYIKRDGKTFGPYYFKSYRENGKVKKIYIGGEKEYRVWKDKEKQKINKKKIYFFKKLDSGTGFGVKHEGPVVKSFKKFNIGLSKSVFLIGVLSVVLLLILGFYFINLQLTGKASLNIDSVYVDGENISGVLKLGLRNGELLPIDSKLVISLGGEIMEIGLSELIESNVNSDFYVEGKEISGSGSGYGFSGLKVIYPDIFFKLSVYDKGESEGEVEEDIESVIEEGASDVSEEIESPIQEDGSDVSEEIESPMDEEENIESVIQEEASDVSDEVSEEVEQVEDASSEDASSEEQGESLITGEAVKENKKEKKENKKEIVDGKCSKDNDFVYELEQGKTAEIKKNSVEAEIYEKGKTRIKKLDDSAVTLHISGSEVRVLTDYSIEEIGFGEEYLGEESFLEISLDELEIKAKDGELKVVLVYESIELADASKEIYVLGEEPEENETEIEENETEIEVPEINITIPENLTEVNITIPVNVTNESLIEISELNISLKQYKAVIGRPVKWLKKIKVDKTSNDSLVLELPKSANNISVRTDGEITQAEQEIDEYEDLIESVDKTSLITGQVTGDVSLEIKSRKGYLTRFWNWVKDLSITGNVIYEDELSNEIVESVDKKEIDLNSFSEADEIGVEYYTNAPLAVEENLSYGKKVVVSADDELNYTDVLAYAVIPNKIKNENNKSIKIYWWVEDVESEVSGVSDESTESIEDIESVMQEEVEEVGSEMESEDENIESVNQEDDVDVRGEEQVEGTENNESVSLITGNVIGDEEDIKSPTQDEASDVGSEVVGEEGEEIGENIESVTQEGLGDVQDSEIGVEQIGEVEEETEVEEEINESAIDEVEEEINISESEQDRKLVKVEVDFSAYDLDEDGYVDYVEWIVPHLSEQVYEIIYITKAEHLDSNKSFVSDIYDEVKERDDNWSEVINESEYVRVSFEQELDKSKDITVFARGVDECDSGAESVVINEIEVPCEVYEKKKRIDEIRGVLR